MAQKTNIIDARTPTAVIRPEISWIFLSDSESLKSNSFPSYLTLPSSISQVARPIVTNEVTDLPHPDSPTSPIIWPWSTFRFTECRASIGPSRVSK